MTQTQTVHINFTGGIVSPGYLKKVLEVAASARVSHVRFGLRQQLIIDIPARQFSFFSKSCFEKDIRFSSGKEPSPNIVSSYPAAGIFTTDSWLREGVYKDIFDSFDYQPRLKINIADSTQSLVPFFTGHINWISSPSAHFWYLYIRFPKTQKVYCFPEHIYTNEVPLLSKTIEKILAEQEGSTVDGNHLYNKVKATLTYVAKPADKELHLHRFSLPYYEGFNRYDNNYWLGIYRRQELYPVSFLMDVCSVCMATKIGQLYTTSWKSIIIKGIEVQDRSLWDFILGKYRINVRHAANELNWQVQDDNEEGLILKRHVIRYFDKEDVRTYGLCFAVQVKPHSGMFGSIIIRKQEVKNPGKLRSLERFEILYTKDFNQNSFEYISFRQNVEKDYIATYLVSLCKLFYERQSEQHAPVTALTTSAAISPVKATANIIYQCKHCLSIYDEATGDIESKIEPNTKFADLPSSYHCPLCDAGREEFIPVEESQLFTV